MPIIEDEIRQSFNIDYEMVFSLIPMGVAYFDAQTFELQFYNRKLLETLECEERDVDAIFKQLMEADQIFSQMRVSFVDSNFSSLPQRGFTSAKNLKELASLRSIAEVESELGYAPEG